MFSLSLRGRLLHHNLKRLILWRMLRRSSREVWTGHQLCGYTQHVICPRRLCLGCECRGLRSPAGRGGLWWRMELLLRLSRRRCRRWGRLCQELQLLRLIMIHAHRYRTVLRLEMWWRRRRVLNELLQRSGCHQRLSSCRRRGHVHLRCGHWSCTKKSHNMNTI